jgi:hypothetical protein
VDVAVEVHQESVDSEIAPAQVLLEARGLYMWLSRIRGIGLGTRRHELDEMPGQRHLSGAVALEDDWRSGPGQLSEADSELRRSAFLDHDVDLSSLAPEQVVADVAADHPSSGSKVAGGSFQERQQLPVVYWLIRAHSTAPT